MNENDMDRYYWKTGQRWGGDNRPVEHIRRPWRYPPVPGLRWRLVLWLVAAYMISMILMMFSHLR